jgi:hypothetical protein
MTTSFATPTSKPFQYDPGQLLQCVTEALNNQTIDSTTTGSTHTKTSSSSPQCHKLYLQHQSYYNRSISHSNTPNRFQQFVQNVLFVYSHNQNYYTSSSITSHHVTLNQFVDLFDDELPYFDSVIYDSQNQKQEDKSTYFDLTDEFIDEIIQDEDHQLLSSRRRHRSQTKKNERHHKFVVFDPHKSYIHHNEHKTKTSWLLEEIKPHQYELGDMETNSSVVTSVNSFSFDFKSSEDDWETYLDWATVDNPDGVAIVHPPIDQVLYFFI